MTTLTRPIKREVAVHHTRPVVVVIDPERTALGFHEKGCRTTYWLPIMTAFRMAVLTEKTGKKMDRIIKAEKKEKP
jgi:hypothetical protein